MNGMEIAVRVIELVTRLAEVARQALAANDPASMRKVQDALRENSIQLKLLEQEIRAEKE